ncbi:hypothetical protein WG936_09065 [Corynebacterium sp. H127]|uniref:hypothetical protein n=1 Tax=Corynebacterium sp. H127 TaxID=3133418 RepID=UPI0030A37BD2
MTGNVNWLQRITHDSTRDIEQRTGMSHTTISRAAKADQPPAHVVLAVARVYGYDVISALQHAGVLTAAEVAGRGQGAALSTFPTTALLYELLERQRGEL